MSAQPTVSHSHSESPPTSQQSPLLTLSHAQAPLSESSGPAYSFLPEQEQVGHVAAGETPSQSRVQSQQLTPHSEEQQATSQRSRKREHQAGVEGEGELEAPAAKRQRGVSTGSKDRHSKVQTHSGLRDRRVRLSVPAALAFYEVQDRLGVEHPSAAVEWLLHHASHAIADLPPLPPRPGVPHFPLSPTGPRPAAMGPPPPLPLPAPPKLTSSAPLYRRPAQGGARPGTFPSPVHYRYGAAVGMGFGMEAGASYPEEMTAIGVGTSPGVGVHMAGVEAPSYVLPLGGGDSFDPLGSSSTRQEARARARERAKMRTTVGRESFLDTDTYPSELFPSFQGSVPYRPAMPHFQAHSHPPPRRHMSSLQPQHMQAGYVMPPNVLQTHSTRTGEEAGAVVTSPRGLTLEPSLYGEAHSPPSPLSPLSPAFYSSSLDSLGYQASPQMRPSPSGPPHGFEAPMSALAYPPALPPLPQPPRTSIAAGLSGYPQTFFPPFHHPGHRSGALGRPPSASAAYQSSPGSAAYGRGEGTHGLYPHLQAYGGGIPYHPPPPPQATQWHEHGHYTPEEIMTMLRTTTTATEAASSPGYGGRHVSSRARSAGGDAAGAEEEAAKPDSSRHRRSSFR